MFRRITVAALATGLSGCAYAPAYEYVPTPAAGNLTADQALKQCTHEIMMAHPNAAPFSYESSMAQAQYPYCMEAKGFEQKIVGDRNLYTGTVTPRTP